MLMLYEIMKSLRNFFPTNDSREGVYEVSQGGSISLPFDNGTVFLVEGSRLNDGVYTYPVEAGTMTAERFKGRVTVLAPPRDFMALVGEIEAFQKDFKPSAFQSESFGGYSYSKGQNGASWQDAFRGRLNAYRRL